ncbi:MAG TPA: aldehyde dehydrogenase family protein, partial [Acidimicrobiales bacterium]|nr:aldehyde dehydrogenase family protein [Acidimicrobiales bacterium]
MTTHAEDVTTRVGLVVGGEVVRGEAGTYPVTNPARPSEVVLDAPATSPAQLDAAVAAARRSQPAWSALAMEERAVLVVAAAEAGVAFGEAHDLARLLTREHGKTHLEAIFDTATMGGMASAFAPVVADALASRELSGGATRVEWVPHGVVAAILPFNWPVSVM